MKITDAIYNRRSIRRFLQKPIEPQVLLKLADMARLYASGGNMQPMKTAVITNPQNLDTVYASLNWAMYLPDFEIKDEEHPTAYIVLLGDKGIRPSYQFDLGAMATNIMLGAMEYGLSSCCLMIARKEPIRKLLALSADTEPEVVIALGFPAQESKEVPFADTQKYTQLPNGDMRVPKRTLAQTLIYTDIDR